jgi:alginate O-acetyltransferase complex protein AlgI
MALGGLWHGASWTFVVWGVLHGLFLVVHRGFRGFAERRPRLECWLETNAGKLLRGAITFLCVCTGWVVFRAPSLTTAVTIFRRMLWPVSGFRTVVPTYTIWTLVAVAVACHVLALHGWTTRLGKRLPAPVVGLSYATVLIAALLLAPMTSKAFIYFQF